MRGGASSSLRKNLIVEGVEGVESLVVLRVSGVFQMLRVLIVESGKVLVVFWGGVVFCLIKNFLSAELAPPRVNCLSQTSYSNFLGGGPVLF